MPGTEGRVRDNTPGGGGSPDRDEAPSGDDPLGVVTSRLGRVDMVVIGDTPARGSALSRGDTLGMNDGGEWVDSGGAPERGGALSRGDTLGMNDGNLFEP